MPTTREDDDLDKDIDKALGGEDGGGGLNMGEGRKGPSLSDTQRGSISNLDKDALDRGVGGLGRMGGGGDDLASRMNFGLPDVRPSQAKFGQYDENGVRRSVNTGEDLDQAIKDSSHTEYSLKFSPSWKRAKAAMKAGSLLGPEGSLVAGVGAGLFGVESEQVANYPGHNDKPISEGGRGGSKDDVQAKVPVASETETPAPAAPEPPEVFTSKARKKKGYLSTILGGEASPEYPRGKTLLGS